ncbi:MAG: MFS transporter [Chloroflexi bacterium]|nr:MFS transporter [Chloroflexota bacterium]
MQSTTESVPSLERENFHHLVKDIGWYGLALPATTHFLSAFAIRLGASAFHLGLMASIPALIVLISAGLSSWWAQRYPDSVHALYWPAVGQRLAFLLPALTPFMPIAWRPYWLVAAIAIPALPQGISTVLFLVMIRESVEKSRITVLLSRRALALNVGVGISALTLGFWLKKAPFPYNYQLMYMGAFLLALVSLWHVKQTKVLFRSPAPEVTGSKESVWKSAGFRKAAMIAGLAHVTFFSVVAMTPLFLMKKLGADESFLAFYAIGELTAGAIVSFYIARIVKLFGNRTAIAIGLMGTGIAAAINAMSPSLPFTLIGAAMTGASWTIAGNGTFGFFSENTPAENMTRYTRVYTQTLFAAMFIGPMIGSNLVQLAHVDLASVLFFGAALRFMGGALIQADFNLNFRHLRLPFAHTPLNSDFRHSGQD